MIHTATRIQSASGNRCGTEPGYQAHYKKGEPICDSCRDARNAARRGRYVPNPAWTTERRRVVLDHQEKTARIPLTKEMFAIVDIDDVELVGQFTWQVLRDGGTWYARRDIRLPGGGKKSQRMHTLVTGWPFTDHRNGDGLDNRRSNLREATKAQNNRNRRKTVGRSRYKGVSWHRGSRWWTAQIRLGGHQTHLGQFLNEEDAARAYDDAARKNYGEFAALNFPLPGERSAHMTGETK